MNKKVRVALFGAVPDTANMGVTALYVSAVTGISRYIEDIEFVVFDYGYGVRNGSLQTNTRSIPLILCGARAGLRYYRSENLSTMHFASKLGMIGAVINKGIRLLDSCDAILDVSGGDSFSDIYGIKRFNGIYLRKSISVNRKKALILLPQTYGPYADIKIRRKADDIVKKSAMAWARDRDSFEILKDMLGAEFDSERHLCGVDMAFSLEPKSASHLLEPTLRSWIEYKDTLNPLIGFNVSGLIYNDPDKAENHYGFIANYRDTVFQFLKLLLDSSPVRIVLISHVMDHPGNFESDYGAIQEVIKELGDAAINRILAAPLELDQSQVKWLIAQMDWFCGTRMHSTIAGLSSGVPTAAISYSDKTKGVFETCGQGRQVFDPRKLEAAVIVSGLLVSFNDRATIRQSLTQYLPKVLNVAEEQMQKIANAILTLKK